MPVNSRTYLTSWVVLTLFAIAVYKAEDSYGAKVISMFFALSGVYIGAKLIPRGRVSPEGSAVFITGCDTGFGNGLARRLDSCGFTVLAGCYLPDGQGARNLAQETSRLTVVPCDVTSDESVQRAKEVIKKELKTQGKELLAVVNNAGIWSWGQTEWVTVNQFKKLAEVNIYGLIRVTHALLPLIRKSKGRVVNVASISGLWTIPSNAPYCMTKYAVECFSDSLRYEMSPWEVKVVIIEPGEYGKLTNIAMHSKESIDAVSNALWEEMRPDVQQDYGREYFDAHIESYNRMREECWDDVTPVVDAMFDAVVSRSPKHRYLVGELWTYYSKFKFTLLPSWLTDGVYKQQLAEFPKPAAMREKYE